MIGGRDGQRGVSRLQELSDQEGEIASQHYAYLVSEAELGEIFMRLQEATQDYCADPGLNRKE